MLLAFGPDDLSKLAIPIGVAIAALLIVVVPWMRRNFFEIYKAGRALREKVTGSGERAASHDPRRLMIDAKSCCAFDAHGWSAELDDGVFTLVSPAMTAELMIRAYECSHSPTVAELKSLAKRSTGRVTNVVERQCGQFYGVGFALAETDRVCRVWLLTLGETLLEVELACDDGRLEEHARAVEPILASLRDARP